jgi:hypothetical protein
VVRENHLDFLFELYSQGVELTLEQKAQLYESKRIAENPIKRNENDLPDNISEKKLLSKEALAIDQNVDIVTEAGPLVIADDDLEERRKKGKYIFEGRKFDITKDEWMPKSTIDHEPDFVRWVDSILDMGFENRVNYRKINLYVQQAYTWLAQKDTYLDFPNAEERKEFMLEETRRCDENTLYFLNKYVYYQEGDADTGKFKYTASPAHEVMAYLNDCGYSACYVKGRQIAATTTLMACDVKDMIFKKNHFMKFITEDQEKAEEIFEDKLKYCFSQLPDWMKPDVQNERDNYFKLGKKEGKGNRNGVNSRIRVVPPKKTAIAGGAPQKVKIDEAGNIGLLTVMINNARPTMFMYDPATKSMKMKRQLIFWGTGGEMEKGGMAFQVEFMSLLKQWKERNFKSGIIPIFFNWTCRPGATQELYDAEKSVAYSKEGPDLKKSIIEFHQSWPKSLADVFMTSEKTLVSHEYIEKQISRIKAANVKFKHKLVERGFFEPIYDFTSPAPEASDVPYKIIGANFVPCDSIDPRASVVIFSHPKRGWEHRYFQGTDPISTDTGLSNFSSAVWDKHFKTFAAMLDFRTKDYRATFLQSVLLGLYYDTRPNPRGIKELVEANIGQSYTQYKENKGFGDSLVLNYELPPYLQNKTTINEGIGIDNKGARNTVIVNRLHELIQAYGDNLFIEIFWEQLKTFVCEVTDGGKESWGPSNRKFFRDDTLFGGNYSYICAELCYPELNPVDNETTNKKTEIVKYELTYDENYNLVRMPVRYINGKRANTFQAKRR